MNLIDEFETEQINRLSANKTLPSFNVGDTLRVSLKINDGNTERLQGFEGVVIAKRKAGVRSSFVMRKISHGEGVERKFMMYSPAIQKIELVRTGIVRRAKLYYLRSRTGKRARIASNKW